MKDLMKDSLKLTLSTLKVASDAAEAHAWHPEQPTSSYQEELRTSSRTATVPGLGRLRGIAEKVRGIPRAKGVKHAQNAFHLPRSACGSTYDTASDGTDTLLVEKGVVRERSGYPPFGL
jgi:hypothetical protein